MAQESYAFNTFETLGIHTAYGTDSPVENLNPFSCIQCAITRQDLTGYPKNSFIPAEKVSLWQALDAYTKGSAYASFEENVKGQIASGFYADLILVNQDLFTIPENTIKDTEVIFTMMNGKIVYQR